MRFKLGGFLLFQSKMVLFFAPVLVFYFGQSYYYEDTRFYFWGNIVLLLVFSIILYLAVKIYNGFDFGNTRIQEIIIGWIISLVIVNTLLYFVLSLLVEHLLHPGGFGAMYGVQILLTMPLSLLTRVVYYKFHPAQRTLIIFGDVDKLKICKPMIAKQSRRFRVTETIYQHEQIGMLLDYINRVQAVFFLDVEESIQEGLLEYCYLNDKHTYVLPTFSRVLFNTAGTIWLANTPVFSLKRPEPNIGTLMIKRLMDITIALVAIIITSPLMFLVWLIIRLQDGESAIYKQTRVTKNGRVFNIYKFRSMIPEAEDDGVPRLTSKDDTRITPFGRFIRRTRIDELPQLFNVLFGAMSLVGPRPERPEIARMYEEIYPSFAFRTKVKAGITGFAQVFGQYNTAPEEKLFLDIMYIESFSILQDIKLMLQTVVVFFKLSSTEGIDNNSTTALK